MEKIIDYINVNYKSCGFTINDICIMLPLSHSYMCKIFKKIIGKSMISYLIDVRIQNAKLLLAKRDLSIKEVAYSVGYSNELHFSKEFLRLTGVTPSNYRREK